MTIGDFYDNFKEIESLENVRNHALNMIQLFYSRSVTADVLLYIKEHNNIPISEDSNKEEKDFYTQIDSINKRIEILKNVEI